MSARASERKNANAMQWQAKYTLPVALASVVIIAVVGVVRSRFGMPPPGDVVVGTPTSTATTMAPVAGPRPKPKNVGNLQPQLSYDAAMDQYRNRRLQFDRCVVTPPQQTYKSGSPVMLDNRSPDSAEIRLDGAPHQLSGYEFKLVTMTAKALPHTVKVDCTVNGTPAYNVAQILLQR